MAGGEPIPGSRVVRVVPDIVGMDRELDYVVPPQWAGDVQLGDLVRIDVQGRRVGAWIVAVDVEPPAGVDLRPLAKVSGRGPAAELVELAGWAAWRWAGRRPHFLDTASPPGVVRALPPPVAAPTRPAEAGPDHGSGPAGGWAVEPPEPVVTDALSRRRGVLRLPPGADRFGLALAAVRAATPVPSGRTLLLCPSVDEARRLADRLRRSGAETAVVAADRGQVAGAGEWARAAAGATVAGARAAAWAPVSPLGRVVVFDEHDEVYKEERSPTWHARDVVIERARRAGAPCLLVSPCPSLEALAWGDLVVPAPAVERAGWPHLTVVDQRQADPTLGPLFSRELVDLVRAGGRVVCVLNRLGRAKLLACSTCASLARCERCEAAVEQRVPGQLLCRRCGTERPVVCAVCGGTRLKNLRLGVSRAREELAVLAGEPVAEISSVAAPFDPDRRIHIGTEAALHRVASADAVAFLDLDQELLAPRYRAAEEAMALLARAARLVRRGGGAGPGRLLVQTRTPDHPVLQAVRHADPGRLVVSEAPMRRALRLPPAAAMALVSGQAAGAFIEALGRPAGLEVQGPVDGVWRLRADDPPSLADALAVAVRPPGRLRIEVDPLRM